MLDWRKSVRAVLWLTVFEGAIRKWVLPQASDFVYFLKDSVLVLAYLQYIYVRRGQLKYTGSPALLFFFIASAIVAIAQALNPNLGSPLAGLFGSRSYILYMPLYFLVGELFSTTQELKAFLQKYLLLALPVCLLGVLQFFSPSDSPINAYATSASSSLAVQDVADFGEENRARITGTFPYIAGHATYTFTLSLLGLALWLNTKGKRMKFILLMTLLLLVLNIIMTGSRAPVFTLAAGIVAFALLGLNSSSRKERRSVRALVGISAFLVIGISLLPAVSGAFLQRASSAGDDVVGRFVAPFWEPIENWEVSGVTGFGAGMCQVGSEALTRALKLPSPVFTPPPMENESTRVMMELGIIGFFIWYLMRGCLIVLLWKTYRGLKTPFLRQLALVGFLVHALTFNSQLILNTTAGIYYWFLAGFIVLLPRLERVARQQEVQQYERKMVAETASA